MKIGTRHSLAHEPNPLRGFALVETLVVVFLVATVCAGALRSLVAQRKAAEALQMESSRIQAGDSSHWSLASLPDGGKVWVRSFPTSH